MSPSRSSILALIDINVELDIFIQYLPVLTELFIDVILCKLVRELGSSIYLVLIKFHRNQFIRYNVIQINIQSFSFKILVR